MPAWSRQRPAWVKRKKRKAKRKKTRKKTSKKKGGTASHWLRELLKLLTGDPRHYSKDPEYKWSDQRTQAFKKEIPAPDVPPGDQPPHLSMVRDPRKDEGGWVHVYPIAPGAD